MTRDEGNYLPVGKRLPSQESLLKYDADAVAMGLYEAGYGLATATPPAICPLAVDRRANHQHIRRGRILGEPINDYERAV
jgi:hypothetical protein